MDSPEAESSKKQLPTLRLIVGAMGGGVVMFLLIAVVVVQGGSMAVRPELAQVMLPILGTLAVGALGAGAFIRSYFRKRKSVAAASAAGSPISGGYAAATIFSAALAEGWGLFGVVAYLITGRGLALVGALAAIVVLAAHWPTQSAAERFESYPADER